MKQSFHDNRQSQIPTNKSEGEKDTVAWSYNSPRLHYVNNIQGTVNDTSKRGRQRLKWSDNMHEWIELNVCDAMRATTN